MNESVITRLGEEKFHGHLTGDIDVQWVASLSLQVTPHLPGAEFRFEMGDVDVEDALGVLEFINLIRLILSTGTRLILVEAPHILAHDLYRIGLLRRDSLLELIDPREELPYG